MSIFEIVFGIEHDCPMGNISRRFPDVKIFEWCNREHEVFEFKVSNEREYSLILEEVARAAEILDVQSDGSKVHLVTRMCQCNRPDSVAFNLDQFNILQVHPVVYEKGWEYYRIMAFKHEEIEDLLKQLKNHDMNLRVIRKVPFDGFVSSSLSLTAGALFSGLTEKQMNALVTAFTYGYYERPRRSDVQTIAAKTHVPRSTFQEHLRKAEKKIVSALIPHIQLYRTHAAEAKAT